MATADTDVVAVDVDPAPVHNISLQQHGEQTQATCSCGRYKSKMSHSRREAYRLGQAHVWHALQRWREAL